MRNILYGLLFGFLLFFLPPGLSAGEDAAETAAPPAEGDPIVATLVDGLKRTRPQVAQAALRKFIGQDAAHIDLNEVRAAIMDTGILEPLDVEILDAEGGGKLIRAEVQDKWSIFPVPIFFFGSGEFQAGGAFYDANSFGLNHKTAVTGMYQSGGWMVYGMYLAPPSGNRIPGWSFSGAFSRNYTVVKGDVRSDAPLWQPERLPYALDFVESLEDLCEKLQTSRAVLAAAYTRAKYPFVSIICGLRKVHHLEENIRGAELKIPQDTVEEIDRRLDALAVRLKA
jgi:hypothetical protein